MSDGYEIICARLLKDVCQKKEWHSLKRILGIVLNKLNKTSTGVDVFKNKIENPFLQEITTATIFNKYLFIYILMAALGVCCCAWGFLQLRQAALLFVAMCRLLLAEASLCPSACGIIPDLGSNLCPMYWQSDSQPLDHQGSPPTITIFLSSYFSM